MLVAWEINRLHRVIAKESLQFQMLRNQIVQLKDQIAYLQLRNQQLKKDPKAKAAKAPAQKKGGKGDDKP